MNLTCKNCGRKVVPSIFSGYEHDNGWIVCISNTQSDTTAEVEDE